MATPKMYPDELRERATRLAVEARQDPARSAGAIARISEQLGINAETPHVGQARRGRRRGASGREEC